IERAGRVPDDAHRTSALLEQPVDGLGEERGAPGQRGGGLGEDDADLAVEARRRTDVGEQVTDVPEVREVAQVREAEEARDEDDVVRSGHAPGTLSSPRGGIHASAQSSVTPPASTVYASPAAFAVFTKTPIASGTSA